jgi:8-oxo-dGTP pyrophosphatase MutT (NUDIX family)
VTGAVTPRRAATIMLLRDSDDLEVLLLRRSGATPFVPGAHVFPGGAVDPADHEPAIEGVVDGLGEAAARRILGVDDGAMAFWFAAVRECLEEAGVLLATQDGRPVDLGHPVRSDLVALRRRIERGDEHLASTCVRHGLRLPLGDLVYVSRWITPAGSPRRYDTRFFAARTPEGQEAVADDWEAVDAAWWRPADALDAWQAGRIDLIEPTVASLTLLADFDTASSALDGVAHHGRVPQTTELGGADR